MEIFVVRHTKTAVPKGICFGQADVPVADSFESEAAFIASKLPCTFDAVFSSPISRCLILAEKLSPITPCLDDRLKEMYFGDWEMKKWDDIPRDSLDKWTENYVTLPPPNGECFRDLFLRVKSFFDENFLNAGYNSVLICTHAGVIRSLIALVLKIKLEETFNYSVEHGSIIKITLSDGTLSINGLMKNLANDNPG